MPGLHMNRWRVASAAAWIALTLALLAAPAIDVERTVQAAQPLEVIGHLGGAAREVVVRDRYAYIATGAALEVWDLRDPTQPRLSGTLPRRGIARGGGTSNIMRLRLEGPHAFLADRNMVQIVDVADPAAPREAGRFARLNATFVDLAVRGRHLYLANGFNVDDGVVIVDISNPSAPVEVGRTADGRYDRLLLSGDRLFALGNLAVSIDRNDRPGMRVYDITAAAPVVVAETTDIRSVGDAALDESHLFKVFNDVLTVFDVSDPTGKTAMSFADGFLGRSGRRARLPASAGLSLAKATSSSLSPAIARMQTVTARLNVSVSLPVFGLLRVLSPGPAI